MAPWIENLNFWKLKDSAWSERLLKSLYYVTWRHGDQFPDEIEKLWSTIASKPRNISPVLDFLITKGIEDCDSNASAEISGAFATYFSVAKRPHMSPLLVRGSLDGPLRNTSGSLSWRTAAVGGRSASGPLTPMPPELNVVPVTAGRSGQLLPALVNMSGPLMGVRSSTGSLRSRHVSRDSGDYLIDTPNSGEDGLHSGVGTHGVNAKELQSALQGHQQHTLTQADIALILLAEIAYENDEDFREHLPLLFHVTFVSMDSSEDIVLEHCQHLLVNLLYSLAGRHLELYDVENSDGENKQQVVSLIKYVQSKERHLNGLWNAHQDTLHADHTKYTVLYDHVSQMMHVYLSFAVCIDRLSFRDTTTENVLLSSMPRDELDTSASDSSDFQRMDSRNISDASLSTAKVPAFEGVQPLVLKGLMSTVSHGVSIELSQDAVVGSASPLQQQYQKACTVATNIAIWCQAKSLNELATVFMAYASGEIKGIENLLACVSPLLCNEWFPKHSALAFGHLLRLLEKGPVEYQRVILLMLKALLQHTPVDAAQSPHISLPGSHPQDPGSFENGFGGTDDKFLAPQTSFKARSGPLQFASGFGFGAGLTNSGQANAIESGISAKELALQNTRLMLGRVLDSCALGRRRDYRRLVPFVTTIGKP
ncbi:UNVERIFIED_CONTAM: hypothetical protein Sradi_0988600 [Sesamum radiatum]|uniref:Uncharacterized protein n=1 Tax=Sesamum radiatum TaxID=300843 RepID=A0AAW2V649_SESRA